MLTVIAINAIASMVIVAVVPETSTPRSELVPLPGPDIGNGVRMSEETVQVLGRIVAAEAEYQDIETSELQEYVADGAFCLGRIGAPLDKARAWTDQWVAPEETHPNMIQRRWNELTAMTAARLCAPCPVREACLALERREPHNYSLFIRGGMTPAQRHLTLEDAIETAEESR
jgi:hypothetical protein